MIVRNEEENIGECLEGIKNFVDEVIVVDTGSTDNTKEIAERYSAKVYDYEWNNDFSRARNYSIAQATSEYILILDADESISDPEALKNDIKLNKDCYLIGINNFISGGQSFTHKAIRIIKNNIGLKFINELHEYIDTKSHLNLKIGEGHTKIIHRGYLDEEFSRKNKSERNLKIIKRATKKNPSAYNYYNLGRCFITAKDYYNATKAFKTSYEISNNEVYTPDLLNKLSLSLKEQGEIDKALEIIYNGSLIFTQETEIIYNLGTIYEELGDSGNAVICYQKCIEIGERGYQVTKGIGSYISKYRIARIHNSNGEYFLAFNLLIDIIKEETVNFPLGIIEFLDVTRKANIPITNVKETLLSICNVTKVEELQLLLDLLYHHRSALLLPVIDHFKVKLPRLNMGIAFLYKKNYIEAAKVIKELKIIEPSITNDVILLGYLLEESNILKDHHLNINKKTIRTLTSIIDKKEVDFALINTDEFFEVIDFLVVQLIRLKELSKLEDLLKLILISNNIKLKTFISSTLYNNGLRDVAKQLLSQEVEKEHIPVNIIEFYAELLMGEGTYEDSIRLYERIYKTNKSYKIQKQLCNLYSRTSQFNRLEQIKNDMKELNPILYTGFRWSELR
ncbi:glycosyltransferase [Rossellomorea marisflavi]|uniref:glycosyltransferase n=2 Tax=Rossellomorea marisflavi TaxID=189381 RepID=UPI003D2D0B56